ncbi:MAG: hypothetical protein ACTHNG_11080 [Ginsengibacter sp.]
MGVLFSFPKRKEIKFVAGNLKRIKALYSDFDTNLPVKINTSIRNKIIKLDSENGDLFNKKIIYTANTEYSLTEYINKYILLEDSTSLQFSKPFAAVDVFENTQQTIEEYSKILLPDKETKKELAKHNEQFILKQFSSELVKRNIIIDRKFTKNKRVKTKGVDLSFEYAWKNGITHLIKPISFDLQEEREIQRKSVEFYGYLNLLEEYAKINSYKFDLLLWKPQNEKLYKSYQNAIEIIEKSKSPKEIYTEDRLIEYSEYTATELQKKDLQ